VTSNSTALIADSSSVTKCDFTRVLARRGTDTTQLYRGELATRPVLLDLKQRSFTDHPLIDTPLVAWVTPTKLMVRSLQLSPKYELDFPHQSTTGTPLSLCWSLLNEKSVPNLILSHGTQITCFAFESNQNWLIERIIQLDEICSHVIGFPHTTLIMLALSPDCTAPFTLVTLDHTNGNEIEREAENEFDINMVTTTLDDVLYVSTTRRVKSKRILTWKERLYRLRDAGHLKDAIRLALLFYRNEAPGKGF